MGGDKYQLVRWVTIGAILVILGGLALTPYFKGNLTVNPVLVNLGSFSLYWYGVTMALATLLAFAVWRRGATPKLGEVHSINLAIRLILVGLAGARVMFVALKWPEFRELSVWEMADLHSGGLSIHGALIAGAIALIIYARRYRLPTLALFDLLVLPVTIGQIIGRLGNFFNQEAFGGPTDLPWKMWVAPAFRPAQFADQDFFHPTFLYSMIGLSLVWAIVWSISRLKPSPGVVLWVYLLAYGIERFLIEFFRVDSDRLSSLSLAQWTSLFVIMIALIFGLIWKGNRKKVV